MTVKLLTEHHLEFLSLLGGCTGSSESIHVKMPLCSKSHVAAHIWASRQENLSLGFLSKGDSNWSPQLHRQAKNWNFAGSKFSYDIFQKVNNKCADQTSRMRRLVCAFVVR